MANKHTLAELKQWQALPLSIKIRMTETRIRGWVHEYGEDGVYISFSGGKDSTVLLDIAENNLPICSVYGEVVEDYGSQIDGQMDLQDMGWGDCRKQYKTTGCERTGCMLCGFGCHIEKSPNRFEMLKETHPGMYGMLDRVTNNGVTMRQAIEWINEHGGLDIKL